MRDSGVYIYLQCFELLLFSDNSERSCVSVGSPYWTDHQRDDRVYVAMPAGKELVLRCPAAGSPSPNITWIKDGRHFDNRFAGQVG